MHNTLVIKVLQDFKIGAKHDVLIPEAVLKAAVEKYKTEQVVTRRALGSIFSVNDQVRFLDSLESVSHLVTDINIGKDCVTVKFEILDTPMGNELINILSTALHVTGDFNQDVSNALILNDQQTIICPTKLKFSTAWLGEIVTVNNVKTLAEGAILQSVCVIHE